MTLRLLVALILTLTVISCKKGDAPVQPETPVPPDHAAQYVSTDNRLLIGVCYYPWYTGGAHWNGTDLRNKLVPAQPPNLGSYDCIAQSTISQHVRWSVQAGIDFWITSWWGQGDETDDVILKGQLANADFRQSMGYCLLYEPRTAIPIMLTEQFTARFLDDVRYMITSHFSRANYLKIDNKPVLYVYLTRTMQGDVASLFTRADSLAQAAGYNGLYVVGDEVYWGQSSDAHLQYMEAVTDYNPHVSQTWVVNGTTFVSRTTSELYTPWMALANSRAKSFWIDVIPGFNDLAVRKEAGHPVIPRYNLDVFSGFLAAVKPVLKQQTIPLKVLVVTSWNEWHEDTQIEPTVVSQAPTQQPSDLTMGNWYDGYGTQYLDLLATFKKEFNQ